MLKLKQYEYTFFFSFLFLARDPGNSNVFLGRLISDLNLTTQNLRWHCCCSIAKSCMSDSVTPWTAAHQVFLSFAISWSLLKLVHWVGDSIQPSYPLSPPFPALNLSQHHSLFQWVALHIKWPKYGNFSFSISPSNEYSIVRASLVAQIVKNLPAMQGTWLWSLGWEDPMEKGIATHSTILAWGIPWTKEPGGL